MVKMMLWEIRRYFFSGVNVHINNGEDSSDTVNGLGNFVIGYA